jgi:hypothetical protein
LRHEKRARSIKELRWKKFKPKAEVVKIGLFDLGYQNIHFFPEKIEFDFDLRFSLFVKYFLVSESKSYILLPI